MDGEEYRCSKETSLISKETATTLPQVRILKRPTFGVTEDTRTALVNAGLESASESSTSRQSTQQQRSNDMEDSQSSPYINQVHTIQGPVRNGVITVAH